MHMACLDYLSWNCMVKALFLGRPLCQKNSGLRHDLPV